MNKWLWQSGLALAGVVALFAGSSHNTLRTASEFIPSEFVDIQIGERQVQVAKYETSTRQWRACVTEGACPDILPDTLHGDLPATQLNWSDVQAYLSWYTERSGQNVRLPSKDEWEFIAADHMPQKTKLFLDPRMAWAASYDMTRSPGDANRQPPGAYGRNQNGVYDIRGNVWEWTSTCVPAFTVGDGQTAPCLFGRVAMGKHSAVLSDQRRDPGKAGCSTGQPPDHVGFRIIIES